MVKKDEGEIIETFRLLGLEREEDRLHFRQLAEKHTTRPKPDSLRYETRHNTTMKEEHADLG